MDVRASWMLELSESLMGLRDAETYLREARQGVCRRLGVDDAFWIEAAFEGETTVAHGDGLQHDAFLSERVGLSGDHPVVLSYFARPTDLSPRRLSDVADRAWLRTTKAYALVGDRLGRHQLNMILRVDAGRGGRGWILGRGGPDFSDSEMQVARGLVAVLVAWDSFYRSGAGRGVTDDATRAAAEVGLTAREVEVLQVVAAGLTATAGARVLRIAPATLRKHLEHVYGKLGTHDRLLAVLAAQQLGILSGPRTELAEPRTTARD